METKNINVLRFYNKLLNHGDNVRKGTPKVAKDVVVPDRGDSIKTGIAFNRSIDAKNYTNTRNEVKKVMEKYKTINQFKAGDKKNLECKINYKDIKDDQKKRSEGITIVKNKAFTEPNQRKLLINIPRVNQKSDIDKVPKNSKIAKSIQRLSSPVLTINASPPTEISKWAQYSPHANYEAWVNYASIPKTTSKSMAKVVKFQKQLERLESSELGYENFADENFIGKIKVNHR